VFVCSAAAVLKLAILIDINIDAANNGNLYVIYLLLSEAIEPEFTVNV
jgi:hypothetical protein